MVTHDGLGSKSYGHGGLSAYLLRGVRGTVGDFDVARMMHETAFLRLERVRVSSPALFVTSTNRLLTCTYAESTSLPGTVTC